MGLSYYIVNVTNAFSVCEETTPLNLSMRVWLEQHVGWAINNTATKARVYTLGEGLESIDSRMMASRSSTAESFGWILRGGCLKISMKTHDRHVNIRLIDSLSLCKLIFVSQY